MTRERKKLGATGEKIAAAYMKNKGYDIVDMNWRCRLGEIDLIAGTKEVLAFCEVKTRKSARFGPPVEAITGAKQAKLRRLGDYYWNFLTDRSRTVRFDAISIFDNGETVEIDHIEDAF